MFERMKGLYEVRVRDQDAKVGEVKVFLIPGNPGERSLMVDAGFGTRECYEKLKSLASPAASWIFLSLTVTTTTREWQEPSQKREPEFL